MVILEEQVESSTYVHIRNQQRNGRKSVTSIQGIEMKFDLEKIMKHLRKIFNCNGVIIDDDEYGKVIQLQGDHRKEIAEFLDHEGIVDKEKIKIHGA